MTVCEEREMEVSEFWSQRCVGYDLTKDLMKRG